MRCFAKYFFGSFQKKQLFISFSDPNAGWSLTQKLTTKGCVDGREEGGNRIIDLLIFPAKPGRKPENPGGARENALYERS